MPAVSIDTFFACSLMVLLVLSSMAVTARLLHPLIDSSLENEVSKKYREIAKYLLLNPGNPVDWGKNGQIIPEEFGLAKANSESFKLDIDKVSRLNSSNLYALSYAQIFTALKIPDTSFKLEIKLVFEILITLEAIFEDENETIYEFEVVTEKNGVAVSTNLRFYVIAENFLQTSNLYASDGNLRFNVTLPNNVEGPALLVVFAKSMYVSKIISFGTYAFAHNSQAPTSAGEFLRLSPLNYTLTALLNYPTLNMSTAYALTFNYSLRLEQKASTNQSVTFTVPEFAEASPILLIMTGWNSTQFFIEWTAYPQIPIEIGADFAHSSNVSNVFTYNYLITINSSVYKCVVWLGGPKIEKRKDWTN